MARYHAAVPTRLVICVDGTWCREDGVTFTGNQTNVNRIWASVKMGHCRDETTGVVWNQKPMYVKGLGTADELDLPKRMIAGAFGKGYSDQIRTVYRHCCELTEHDEVWLYGFSRGAFVVRAVAGLLHCLRAIRSSRDQFEKDYKEGIGCLNSIRRSRDTGTVRGTCIMIRHPTDTSRPTASSRRRRFRHRRSSLSVFSIQSKP